MNTIIRFFNSPWTWEKFGIVALLCFLLVAITDTFLIGDRSETYWIDQYTESMSEVDRLQTIKKNFIKENQNSEDANVIVRLSLISKELDNAINKAISDGSKMKKYSDQSLVPEDYSVTE